MGLLNLLTAYQKKHLVEFLPYHECDNQSRQAPDLDCLIKLQAQSTQQRHLIFLTGITDVSGALGYMKYTVVEQDVAMCILQRDRLRCSYNTPETE